MVQALERAGIVERRILPRPASSVVYELTAYGRELEPILHALGGWGLQSLGEPRPGPAQEPELTLQTDLTIRALLAGEVTPQAALRKGQLRLTGKRALLKGFFEVFRLPSYGAST